MVGTSHFWVKRIEHEISRDTVVTLWLEGGVLNKYREYVLEKALFQGETQPGRLHQNGFPNFPNKNVTGLRIESLTADPSMVIKLLQDKGFDYE